MPDKTTAIKVAIDEHKIDDPEEAAPAGRLAGGWMPLTSVFDAVVAAITASVVIDEFRISKTARL